MLFLVARITKMSMPPTEPRRYRAAKPTFELEKFGPMNFTILDTPSESYGRALAAD